MTAVRVEKLLQIQHAIACIVLIILVGMCQCQEGSDICSPIRSIRSRNNSSYQCTLQMESDVERIPQNSVEVHLSFSANRQFRFAEGFIPSLHRLEKLHLYVSLGSEKLPARFFSNLGHLKKLMLYKEDSVPDSFELQLEDDTFRGLESLTELHMPALAISTLPSKVFNGLVKLQKLNLNKNRVSEIKYGTFQNCCQELKNLFLGENDISDLGLVSFNGLDSLQTIDFHGNKISRVERLSFRSLDKLVDVNLGANKISSIEAYAFEKKESLNKLYLDLNELTRLESSMFNGLSLLTELELSNNSLDSLESGTFANLKSLKKLSLSHNKINSIMVDPFEGLRNLTELELNGNQIYVLDDSTFFGLHNLKILELENNKISVIQKKTFIPVLHLRELYLQHNKLKHLSPTETNLSNLASLTTFSVSHNPWHCTCDLQPLIVWMKKRAFVNSHLGTVCASPRTVRNTPVSDCFKNSCSDFSDTSSDAASGKTSIHKQLILLVSFISTKLLSCMIL